ncbi:MAG: alpha/beta fold hydrolase [Actinomycetes bacterium]
MPRRAPRLTRATVLVGVSCMLGASMLVTAPAGAASEVLRLPGGPTSGTDPAPVSLDAEVYAPTVIPAPAILLAHGFGGSKDDLAQRANDLAERGYVVLTYSARGFGLSTGQISMNSPEFEVADARALVDYLATRPDVVLDRPGDPRVGVAGGSYGGALALLLGGYDARIDAIASDITWNDLESSLFGQSATEPGAPLGVFKQQWTGAFFGVGTVNRDGKVTECGRFTPAWCRAYTEAAADGIVSPASERLMAQSSPRSITSRITAPTLVSGGQADSLFPLAQTNANAEQISAAHPSTPVKVVWHGGGHDGGVNEQARIDALAADWFDTWLLRTATASTDFEVTQTSAALSVQNSGTAPVILQAPEYPGLHGASTQDVAMGGPPQRVLSPAGGVPAAITSVPGLGGAAGALAQRALPGQFAVFESPPLTGPLSLIGSSRIKLAVSAVPPSPAADIGSAPAGDATLFASVRIVTPNGRESLPQGLVAPVHITGLSTSPTTVSVDLPAVVASAGTGDRLRVIVSTTDFAYRLPVQPSLYDISLAEPSVTVPLVAMTPVSSGAPAYWWLLGAAVVVGLLVLLSRLVRVRHPHERPDAPADARPLVIDGLSKRYGDGYLAVDDLSFAVRPGTVLGLLGPNGAGKTTTMRMVMGLIMPSSGTIEAFGQPVYAGAPVLSRIGSLVEGAGFLPHLTGRQNLDLYWRSAGRTHDPSYLDEVLEIADLGSAIDKKVRSYSQGMRQRLGIAQAMLGKPDLLMLDEPTNGLDPPQIKEMRDVLHRYAAEGRTVIISSHMLSEVEQTCTDVVVMHRGRLVGAGSVEDLLRDHAGKRLEDVFLEIVGDDLTVGLA